MSEPLLRRTTGVADNRAALEMRRMSDGPTASTPAHDPATWCGLKDNPDFVQCCCNCQHLHPVHYHCCTEPKPTEEQKKAAGIEGRCVCGVQKGWACFNPEMDGRIYDNWPQHCCGCECYTPKPTDNTKTKPI